MTLYLVATLVLLKSSLGPYNGKPLGKTCPRVHVARLDGIRLLRVAILSSRFSRRVFRD